eukprot:jgi/Mesvir1/20432/Mv12331-RA.1
MAYPAGVFSRSFNRGRESVDEVYDKSPEFGASKRSWRGGLLGTMRSLSDVIRKEDATEAWEIRQLDNPPSLSRDPNYNVRAEASQKVRLRFWVLLRELAYQLFFPFSIPAVLLSEGRLGAAVRYFLYVRNHKGTNGIGPCPKSVMVMTWASSVFPYTICLLVLYMELYRDALVTRYLWPDVALTMGMHLYWKACIASKYAVRVPASRRRLQCHAERRNEEMLSGWIPLLQNPELVKFEIRLAAARVGLDLGGAASVLEMEAPGLTIASMRSILGEEASRWSLSPQREAITDSGIPGHIKVATESVLLSIILGQLKAGAGQEGEEGEEGDESGSSCEMQGWVLGKGETSSRATKLVIAFVMAMLPVVTRHVVLAEPYTIYTPAMAILTLMCSIYLFFGFLAFVVPTVLASIQNFRRRYQWLYALGQLLECPLPVPEASSSGFEAAGRLVRRLASRSTSPVSTGSGNGGGGGGGGAGGRIGQGDANVPAGQGSGGDAERQTGGPAGVRTSFNSVYSGAETSAFGSAGSGPGSASNAIEEPEGSGNGPRAHSFTFGSREGEGAQGVTHYMSGHYTSGSDHALSPLSEESLIAVSSPDVSSGVKKLTKSLSMSAATTSPRRGGASATTHSPPQALKPDMMDDPVGGPGSGAAGVGVTWASTSVNSASGGGATTAATAATATLTSNRSFPRRTSRDRDDGGASSLPPPKSAVLSLTAVNLVQWERCRALLLHQFGMSYCVRIQFTIAMLAAVLAFQFAYLLYRTLVYHTEGAVILLRSFPTVLLSAGLGFIGPYLHSVVYWGALGNEESERHQALLRRRVLHWLRQVQTKTARSRWIRSGSSFKSASLSALLATSRAAGDPSAAAALPLDPSASVPTASSGADPSPSISGTAALAAAAATAVATTTAVDPAPSRLLKKLVRPGAGPVVGLGNDSGAPGVAAKPVEGHAECLSAHEFRLHNTIDKVIGELKSLDITEPVALFGRRLDSGLGWELSITLSSFLYMLVDNSGIVAALTAPKPDAGAALPVVSEESIALG